MGSCDKHTDGNWTHEFGTEGAKHLELEFLGVAKKPTFNEILNLIPKDKQLILIHR